MRQSKEEASRAKEEASISKVDISTADVILSEVPHQGANRRRRERTASEKSRREKWRPGDKARAWSGVKRTHKYKEGGKSHSEEKSTMRTEP